MEGRNVDTIRRINLKQGITSAHDLTIDLSE